MSFARLQSTDSLDNFADDGGHTSSVCRAAPIRAQPSGVIVEGGDQSISTARHSEGDGEVSDEDMACDGDHARSYRRFTKRHKRLQCGNNFADGPSTPTEVHGWVSHALQSLAAAALMVNLVMKVSQGVTLSTDWSGAGTAEQAAGMLLSSLTADQIGQGGIECFRACDVDPTSLSVLCNHRGPLAPRHVLPDILSRIDNDTLEKLKHIELKWRTCEDGKQAAQMVHRIRAQRGLSMVHEMIEVLRAMPEPKVLTSHCLRHDDICPLDEYVKGRTRVWVAGHSCLDWSTMGNRMGWLGLGTTVLLVYIFHILAALPEIVIEECTQRFDISIWKMLLGDAYHIMVRTLCPTQFGIPNERPRQYSVSVLKSTHRVLVDFESPEFDQLFFRKLKSCATLFFQGSDAERDACIKRMAGGRKSTRTMSSRPTLQEVLPPGPLCRLQGHHMMAEHDPCFADAPCLLANISQNPGERFGLSQNIPVLLRESTYVMIKGPGITKGTAKIMIANEALAAMGWPVYQEDVHCALRDSFESLPEASKAQLAGNGMSVPVIGSVLMYALACTAPLDAGASAGSARDTGTCVE